MKVRKQSLLLSWTLSVTEAACFMPEHERFLWLESHNVLTQSPRDILPVSLSDLRYRGREDRQQWKWCPLCTF